MTVNFEDMTVAELKEYAELNDITISATKKAEIIIQIKEQMD